MYIHSRRTLICRIVTINTVRLYSAGLTFKVGVEGVHSFTVLMGGRGCTE